MERAEGVRPWADSARYVTLLSVSRVRADDLRDALRISLLAHLAADGWSRVAGDEDRLVGLVRPVGREFVATVEVLQASSVPDRPPVTIIYMNVGVGYEPLRRLAPLLGMFDLDLQNALVWPPAVAEQFGNDSDSDDVEADLEEDEAARWDGREVRTVDEARVLGAELAAVVGASAVPFADRYADVDRLLRRMPGPRTGSLCQPALLAAAGRFDEARVLLARLPPPAPGLTWMLDQQRAARQLGRWIDSGGDPALIPGTPPRSPHEFAPMPPLASVMRRSRQTSAAVRVVRRAGVGKDRDELRAMLERELGSRDVTQSPLWYEHALDHVYDTRAQTTELVAKGLLSVGKLGIRAFRGIRAGSDPPDLSVPGWLEPPPRAAWTVRSQLPGRYVEVQLADGIAEWLDNAYRAIPRLLGRAATLHAWLDRDPDAVQELAVHLGEKRVGTLLPPATGAYEQEMNAAGEREELPRVNARLTPRAGPSRYLLEVEVPG